MARARWSRKHRWSRYHLTEQEFFCLLEDQNHACAMCHVAFRDNQAVFIDHDHSCCPAEKRSCGRCIRGLLCLRCNTGLGYIERLNSLAQAYTADPPGRLLRRSPVEKRTVA